MSRVDEVARTISASWATLRAMPPEQYGLRAAVLGAGAGGLAVAVSPNGIDVLWGTIAAVGLLAIVRSGWVLAQPVYLIAVGLMWLTGHATHRTPAVGAALALAVLLYLVHSTGALLAAMPCTAHIDRPTLRRWYARVLVVLLVVGALAGILTVTATLPGSLGLELAGMAGVVLLIAAPILALQHRRPPAQDNGPGSTPP